MKSKRRFRTIEELWDLEERCSVHAVATRRDLVAQKLRILIANLVKPGKLTACRLSFKLIR